MIGWHRYHGGEVNGRGLLLVGVLLLVNMCAAAQVEYRPIVVAIRPVFDIPVAPDHLLFQPSGGASLAARYVIPSLPLVSVGGSFTWHLARMQHADLGQLGSLSLAAGEATVELRSTFRMPLDLFLAAGVGWFYAFLNGAPSQFVTSLAWSSRAGVGYRLSPLLTLNLDAEYRRYETLYHFIGIGVGADIHLGDR